MSAADLSPYKALAPWGPCCLASTCVYPLIARTQSTVQRTRDLQGGWSTKKTAAQVTAGRGKETVRGQEGGRQKSSSYRPGPYRVPRGSPHRTHRPRRAARQQGPCPSPYLIFSSSEGRVVQSSLCGHQGTKNSHACHCPPLPREGTVMMAWATPRATASARGAELTSSAEEELKPPSPQAKTSNQDPSGHRLGGIRGRSRGPTLP